MGCITSKQAVSVTPAFDYSGALRDNGSEILASSLRNRTGLSSESKNKKNNKNKIKIKKKNNNNNKEEEESSSCIDDDDDDNDNRKESRREKSISGDSLSLRLGNLQKYVEGEQVAAGWPAWLSAVAGEAIQGWVPLRADSFEKLEKIGQGTYSSVFRARDLDTGRIVALKKVRFDNFEPESVRFMAREILILRRLDHPNIIKLEGIVTSRLSCSIYLVFEYMEHDLAGLSSSPDIKFSEAQVKCYMKQLLSGIEHCHSRGIMHRDIKGSNLLVSNDGILKVADFGLANFCSAGYKQPLTSRVVTLWYRPPELLLGSTDYGATVDIWSVGCVFAELFLGKPILQGRTEVEQLHKIFKLCGSPPDEYWKKSRLPHATIFKPQHPYESCLRETCNELPTTAVKLIQTLLSVEPYKRGNASSALASEYFSTRPYACDPSTLPKYPPNKEIDAKIREEARKRARGRGLEGTRRIPKTSKVLREPNGQVKSIAPTEEPQVNNQVANKINGVNGHLPKEDADAKVCPEPSKPSAHKVQESSHVKNAASQGDIPFSGPLDMMPSSGFSWVKRRKEDVPSKRSYSRSSSKSQVSSALDPSSVLQVKNISDSKCQENGDIFYDTQDESKHQNSYEIAKHVLQKQWTTHLERPDSFDASDGCHPHALSGQLYQIGGKAAQKHNVGYQDEGERVEYSGPLLSQSHRVDELLEKHERHIRRTVRKSWFQRGKKHEK